MDTPISLQVSVEGNQVIFDFADDAEAQQWNNRLRRKRKKLLFSPYGLCFLALGKDERIAFQMEAEEDPALLFSHYLLSPPTCYVVRGTTWGTTGELNGCEWHSRMPTADRYSEPSLGGVNSGNH